MVENPIPPVKAVTSLHEIDVMAVGNPHQDGCKASQARGVLLSCFLFEKVVVACVIFAN